MSGTADRADKEVDVPTLIIFSGLPGAGKTAIARELAHRVAAVYLRIDSIEQALRDSGGLIEPLNDAGYRAAYALAEDNLRLGHTVVADSVNPLAITRDAWVAVATRAHARALEIEVLCSDPAEHRRRVEQRVSHMAGLRLPTWNDVLSREYHQWNREHVTIDTATRTVEQSVSALQNLLNHSG